MDVETSEAIETLRDDIAQLERRITAQLSAMRGSISAEMALGDASLRAEIAAGASLRASLRAEMAEGHESLRKEMLAMRTELRVHAQMLNDSVRDDIRIVAEAVAVISAKLDAR
jgi:hypothetical protein